jgi:predicted choloylglycine hydrolase
MNIYNFKGTPYEIGKQMGKSMKEYKFKPITRKAWNKENFAGQFKAYTQYYPEKLEEINGMAHGLKLNEKDRAKLLYQMIDIDKVKHGCSIFGYHGLIGRNYDWWPEAKKLVDVYVVKNPKFNYTIGVSDGGITTRVHTDKKHVILTGADFYNNNGLFIGYTYAFSKSWNYGLTYSDYMRKISETCNTVKDVLDVIKTLPLSVPKNFYVADKSGESILIEHNSGTEYKIIRPTNDLLIKTNIYLNKDFIKKYDLAYKGTPYGDVMYRQNTIKKLAEKIKPKTLIDIKRILDADHVYYKEKHLETIFQLLIDIKKRDVYLMLDGKIINLDNLFD